MATDPPAFRSTQDVHAALSVLILEHWRGQDIAHRERLEGVTDYATLAGSASLEPFHAAATRVRTQLDEVEDDLVDFDETRMWRHYVPPHSPPVRDTQQTP